MFGRNLLTTDVIQPTRVSADGSPEYKAGGITIDWNLVVAPVADVVLADGSTVRLGHKYLRYGQVMTKVTLPDTETLTITATGGTYGLSVAVAGGATVSTANNALAFNANAATIQAALVALSNVGAGNATVVGGGSPFTVSFANSLGTVVLTPITTNLTGGTATVTEVAPGGNLGWFGPYDPAATDGRATFTRGEAYILDMLVLQYPGGLGGGLSGSEDHVGAIEGGLVYIDRVLHSGTAAHTLALGPTLAEIRSTFPRLREAKD